MGHSCIHLVRGRCAQFTPKIVETAVERRRLMFRFKAQIAPELLRRYVRDVKTGVPGIAYVKLDLNAQWPANLEEKLPQATPPKERQRRQ